MTLQEFFRAHPKAAIAFSGGADSAYLLHAARAAGCDVKPYFVKTPFQPAFELADAKRLAPELTVIEIDLLNRKRIEKNEKNRCYFCKKQLINCLKNRAEADGFTEIWDGTNASDDASDRPGMQALQELGVLSPLRLCGLSKEEIRLLSKEAGLFTWNKPAYACLATRIPTGMAIHRETLEKVEAAEEALMALGYRDLRVRVTENGAKIQLPLAQFPTCKDDYIRILTAVKPWFPAAVLDLRGR